MVWRYFGICRYRIIWYCAGLEIHLVLLLASACPGSNPGGGVFLLKFIYFSPLTHSLMALDTHTITIGDQALSFYYKKKQGHGRKTIVFLHGWGLGPEYHLDTIDKLSKEYNVLAPDMGELSYMPQTFEEQMDLLCQFLKTMHRGPYHIVGYSIGGCRAMHLSERVNTEAITIIHPAIFPKSNGPIRMFMYGLLKNVREYRGKLGEEFQELTKKVSAPFLRNILSKPKQYYNSLKAMFKSEPPKVTVPTTLITGEHGDEYFDYSSDSKRMLAVNVKDLEDRVVEDKGGHSWPMADTDAHSSNVLDSFKD